MEKLEFVLPLPPSQNHAFMRIRRRSKSGKIYQGQKRTPKADEWYYNAIEYVKERIDLTGWETTKKKKVIVDLLYNIPRERACDCNNTPKLLLDVLEKAGVYDNDYYALPRLLDFHVVKGVAKVKVTCYILEGGEKIEL